MSVLAVIASVSACDQAATSPVAPSTTTSAPLAPVVDVPLDGPVIGTYVFRSALAYPVSEGTRLSRYLFVDATRFALRYDDPSGGFTYHGSYEVQPDGQLRLLFDANPWLPWAATARLKGGVLTVDCNEMMEMSDFYDAVYVRVETGQRSSPVNSTAQ